MSTWLKSGKYLWLELQTADDNFTVTDVMCTLCKRHSKAPRNGTEKWVRAPCQTVRKDKVDSHLTSAMHKAAVAAERDRIASRTDGGIRQAMEETVSLQTKAVLRCFQVVYWLVKQELPHHTNYTSLLKRVEDLGCDYSKALKVGRNATYTSNRILDEFLDILSAMVKEHIVATAQETESFALMCDESTHVGVLKQLATSACARTASARLISCPYLQNGTAQSITTALESLMDECNLSLDKLPPFGSDGAGVMVGKCSGVAARLAQHNSSVVSIHCIAHRLPLATGQAGNRVPHLKKVKDWLSALWKHFHYSPVRAASLVEMQRVLNLDELKVVKAADTRWLSHHAPVTTLLRILPAVLSTLHAEGRKDATAYGLHHQVATYSFIAALHLLDKALSSVSRLSRPFQARDVDLSLVQPLVATAKARLRQLKDMTNDDFQSQVKAIINKFEEDVQPGPPSDAEDVPDPDDEPGDDDVEEPVPAYQLDISVTALEMERFERTRLQFLHGMLDNLDQKFPCVSVLDAFSVLQPEHIQDPVDQKF